MPPLLLTLFLAIFASVGLHAAAADPGDSGRPFVFSRKQHKYNHYTNYTEFWIDRPLFLDRSDRYPKGEWAHFNQESVAQEVREVQQYELDGLAAFIVGSGRVHYQRLAGMLEKLGPTGFLMLPEITGSAAPSRGSREDRIEGEVAAIDEALQKAFALPLTWRLAGRVVVSSYVMDRRPPSDWAPVLERLRARHDGKLLFVADLAVSTAHFHRASLLGKDLEEPRETFKRAVRSYLDVADGVMVASANHLDRSIPFRYAESFDADFYGGELIPALRAVLSEPPYQRKLLGLSATKAYVNHDSGVIHAEEGTRRLRTSLEIALKARPDFVMLPEWNEVNENTCFAPTVATSFSTQRIIRYFMRRLKGEAPVPNEGDSLSTPNLVLSYRRVLKPGDTLSLEVLNIPDGQPRQTYRVALALRNLSGKVIKRFEKREIASDRLGDLVFVLPTGEAGDERVLLPSLEVTDGNGTTTVFEEGLLYVEVRPTWNTDYLEVHQPLRDLLKPDAVEFRQVARPDGKGLAFQAGIEAGEELAQVELLENRTEVFAVDRLKEFDRDRYLVLRGQLIGKESVQLKGRLTVRNASSFVFRSNDYPSTGFTGYEIDREGVAIDQRINQVPRGFFLLIPKEEIGAVEIGFQSNIGDFSIPVAQLARDGVFGKTFPRRFTATLWRYDKLPDIAVPLNRKSAAFETEVLHPETPFPIYHLRAITKSGRIYRSRPIRPWQPKGEMLELPVFSESEKKVVSVPVRRDEVADLDYRFDPRLGDLIGTPAGLSWIAELGGGLIYGGPANRDRSYPREAVDSNPQWVTEEGRTALKFDGVGQYVAFPKEVLPHGSFTLRFEIKPSEGDARNEVLFRHFGMRAGSLTLRRSQGRLVGAFTDPRQSELHDNTTTHFDTGLALPAGEWSAVEVSYNLGEIVFRVAGQGEKRYPFSQPGAAFQTAIFGGNRWAPFGVESGDLFFKGWLRSFRVLHHAPPSAAVKDAF
ncbi:MAG TPA: LamG-like jellyroll fold domain-containing protein [Chthoniobacteraceae bacterium]|nr:LamG-like jellyroll fold domain-containing protein [Chthoniobacteraceae bacterium]